MALSCAYLLIRSMIVSVHNTPVEASYPLEFRVEEAKNLGEQLRFRHNVELVGMKHVGIGNFLSYFLNHAGVVDRFINHGEKHLFITVDLNDLVEREIHPFWVLLFKRVVDSCESIEIDLADKKEISSLFLSSIQSQDLFSTIENLKKSLNLIVKNDFLPTIFLLRLDRLKDVFNEEFFSNLEGLVDATGQKLAYVFTSYRSLGEIAQPFFEKKYPTLFPNKIYVKPAGESDTQIIFKTFEKKYELVLDKVILKKIFDLSAGHVQYLQLSLLILKQKIGDNSVDASRLMATIAADERVNLLSEEIWESLTREEQEVLKKIRTGKSIGELEKKKAQYLWDCGVVSAKNSQIAIFNPLFENYLKGSDVKGDRIEAVEFTKKENLLFLLLKESVGEVCEREKIIKTVWPEYEEVGVSDWTIDRLVARLRNKLKQQNSPYTIKTIKTRGYMLVEES
ncbi:MAG: helix-turn-helix domain-containing protein [Candidatus Curtissbacteria bacterium]|nr:helix-turn-helix domain-containing protein [Candidatus Curtissbacteria bacterium]